jgi:sialate O-acetylesterase
MITSWRRQWAQGDFPFLIVQLANFMKATDKPVQASNWAELRDAQLQTARVVPATGLAVALDIGDAQDIHPRNKQEVGRRLALAARKLAHQEDVVWSGPVFREMEREGDRLVLHFDHCGGGLRAKDAELAGFAVAGADRVWYSAMAEIRGDAIVLRSLKVPEPIAARYAWADNPPATLYNAEGLPATPFRTDDWPNPIP